MKKNEAEKLLTDFFARFGKTGFAFEQSDFIKANIGESIFGFEFRAAEQVLECHALIYRFRRSPPPEVLRQIEIAQKNGADTGGGGVAFDSQNLTLSLVKIYSETVESALFAAQMQKMAAASLIWSSTILDRTASKSSHV